MRLRSSRSRFLSPSWRDDNAGRSLDPAVGMLRSGDDSWLMLPEGAAGDAVVREFVGQVAPMQRSATPADIADIALLLATNSYLTGDVIMGDGGRGLRA